jgi:hypothetical protein
MGKYKYLMIHCTATVQGSTLNEDSIKRMHMGAKKLDGGKVRYKGVTYDSIDSLPDEKIGSVHSTKTRGRGWGRVGYSQIFFEDGTFHKFVEHNEDQWISSSELTYGAVGFNSVTKHFVYAGGLAKSFKVVNGRKKHDFKNTMSSKQEWELICAIKNEIIINPDVKIIGHNQTAVKNCPCFDIREWCRLVGLPEKNIDTRKVRVKLKFPTTSFHETITSQPPTSQKEGNDFRCWVNGTHRAYAQEIDLDPTGSFNNSYIKKAWLKYGEEYNEYLNSI